MSDPRDPAAMFQSFLTDWERNVNAFANKTMGGADFGKFMQTASGAGLQAREATTEMANRYLETMNLPSRDSVAALGERLALIEAQLALVNAKLDLIGAAMGALGSSAPAPESEADEPARVARTRKPPRSEAGASARAQEGEA